MLSSINEPRKSRRHKSAAALEQQTPSANADGSFPMLQYCENPYCPATHYDVRGCDVDLDVCPECGHFSCGRCGSHFDPEYHSTDTCIYCGGTGRIDCDERERNFDFCSRCGDRCCRYAELEEEHEQILKEYRG